MDLSTIETYCSNPFSETICGDPVPGYSEQLNYSKRRLQFIGYKKFQVVGNIGKFKCPICGWERWFKSRYLSAFEEIEGKSIPVNQDIILATYNRRFREIIDGWDISFDSNRFPKNVFEFGICGKLTPKYTYGWKPYLTSEPIPRPTIDGMLEVGLIEESRTADLEIQINRSDLELLVTRTILATEALVFSNSAKMNWFATFYIDELEYCSKVYLQRFRGR